MARKSKWIEARPDDDSRLVAERSLDARLRQVWHYLDLSVRDPHGDTENVHQLRVYSRRAAAAIDIFQNCLPRRRGRWMRKQIKRVRKAAGAARDFDVLIQRWQQAESMHSPDASLVVRQIKEHRKKVQEPIEKIYKKLSDKHFERRVARLLKRVHNRKPADGCGDPFETFARDSLKDLVIPYLRAGQGELHETDALHAFRIQGKQVRYAMEIFAGAFDEDFRDELYPLVTTLQERLGAINDHVAAQTYFVQWHAVAHDEQMRKALESAITIEHEAVEATKQGFFAWWTADRREKLCRGFSRYVELREGTQSELHRDDHQDPPREAV